MRKLFAWVTPETRSWLYGIGIALLPLLATLGVLNDDLVKDIALVLSALFGMGSLSIAKVNVSKPTAVKPEDARG